MVILLFGVELGKIMRINGSNQDDTLIGTVDDDRINGRKGFDTVIYDGSVLNYSFGSKKSSTIVTGPDSGRDTLSNIEALQFDDATIYLDGRNNGPFAQQDTLSTNEDTNGSVNVLNNDWDFDGDSLSVVSLDTSLTAGSALISPNNDGTITYDPGTAFQHLGSGESATDTFIYIVSDGTDEVQQSVQVTVTGLNDAPTHSGPLTITTDEDQLPFSIDLLQGANDLDENDILSIEVTSTQPVGLPGFTVNGTQLDIDPNAFNYLSEGQSEQVTFNYNITDTHGASVTQSATIDITGVNDAPGIISAESIIAPSIYATEVSFISFHGYVWDFDQGDTLTISNIIQTGGDPVTIIFDEPSGEYFIDTSSLADLLPGEEETLEFSYEVTDSAGASVAQTSHYTFIGYDETSGEGITVVGTDALDFLNGTPNDDLLISSGEFDALFGDAGADTFKIIGPVDIFAEVGDFSAAEGDKIDLSDLLTDYNAATDNLSDFVRVEEVSEFDLTFTLLDGRELDFSFDNDGFPIGTMISVNADGTGSDFEQVALLTNSSTDLTTLLNDGSLIVE